MTNMKVKNNAVLGDFVYERLKEMILSKQIVCGEKIVEQKLETQLGVSRTPVREAIRRLSMDGIVNLYPNRYAEVITFDDDSIREFGTIRVSMDCLAAQLAIQNASNRDFQSLNDLAKKCTEANDAGDLYDRIKYDSEFHLTLAKLSGNPFLFDFEEKLCLKTRLLQVTLLENTSSALCNIHQHEGIVSALINRDAKKVTNLISQHLCPFYKLKLSEFYLPVFSL